VLSLEILGKLFTSRCRHGFSHLTVELLHHSETLSFQKSLNLLQSVSWNSRLFLVERIIKRLLLRVDQGAILKQWLSRRNVASSLSLSFHLLLNGLLLLLLSLGSLLVELNLLVHVHGVLLTISMNVKQVFMSCEAS